MRVSKINLFLLAVVVFEVGYWLALMEHQAKLTALLEGFK